MVGFSPVAKVLLVNTPTEMKRCLVAAHDDSILNALKDRPAQFPTACTVSLSKFMCQHHFVRIKLQVFRQNSSRIRCWAKAMACLRADRLGDSTIDCLTARMLSGVHAARGRLETFSSLLHPAKSLHLKKTSLHATAGRAKPLGGELAGVMARGDVMRTRNASRTRRTQGGCEITSPAGSGQQAIRDTPNENQIQQHAGALETAHAYTNSVCLPQWSSRGGGGAAGTAATEYDSQLPLINICSAPSPTREAVVSPISHAGQNLNWGSIEIRLGPANRSAPEPIIEDPVEAEHAEAEHAKCAEAEHAEHTNVEAEAETIRWFRCNYNRLRLRHYLDMLRTLRLRLYLDMLRTLRLRMLCLHRRRNQCHQNIAVTKVKFKGYRSCSSDDCVTDPWHLAPRSPQLQVPSIAWATMKSSPIKANQIQFPTGSLQNFCTGIWFRTIPLIGRFLGGVLPPPDPPLLKPRTPQKYDTRVFPCEDAALREGPEQQTGAPTRSPSLLQPNTTFLSTSVSMDISFEARVGSVVILGLRAITDKVEEQGLLLSHCHLLSPYHVGGIIALAEQLTPLDIHGDSSPFLLQRFHELSNEFWPRLTSPHTAIQFVPKMFYRVEVGALGGPVQSANIVVGVPLHIDGFRAVMIYPGQPRTCSYCQSPTHERITCPCTHVQYAAGG
ncbi:hypothetical protein PR048_028285 [Dryococelus australis]|uniref:Uncharacterized protein n=1 Tax=Dryococelus australis TaxID=614101 RepID=A0ABQ9GIU8_9NEOP|nr:hypothetical protein PR048_028285 [Dryococelus australis]